MEQLVRWSLFVYFDLGTDELLVSVCVRVCALACYDMKQAKRINKANECSILQTSPILCIAITFSFVYIYYIYVFSLWFIVAAFSQAWIVSLRNANGNLLALFLLCIATVMLVECRHLLCVRSLVIYLLRTQMA